ncbi:TPA: hypothetical protein PTV74_002133 [Clostridium botulinum]|nr:hypothetical protein [Clostridium botulinum]HDK7182982.1 hypothetical protein [Clostridium botulinum]HDK7186776.1 hypothetical protein [Clostridium botulinum]HDK7193302.1 hypothetical protein [Clostridium botulinum]HDK7205152.1 hypothetical protein [Clostridium botulinum]
MTKVGQVITEIYSLLIVTTIIGLDIKRMIKNSKTGWIAVALTPVFILLINIVWRW